MIKQLTPLEALNDIQQTLGFTEQDTKEDKERVYQDLDIIETALKEKGKQDLILDFLKEHIVFEGGVAKADFQWIIEDKETEEAIKEWLK